jgi:methylmalonyl-CoA mutase N-terminal domain/subunit
MARAIKDGWLESRINAARYRNQDQIDKGARTLVGVNRFSIPDDEEIPVKVHKLRADEWGAARSDYLRAYRARRDDSAWRAAIASLEKTWRDGGNMVPAIMAALRSHATMGEIHEAMRRAQGVARRR